MKNHHGRHPPAIIVAISGASGAVYGVRLLQALRDSMVCRPI
jgi:3-polyprenyl-4-hydroxybenzoate decarboxylase